MFKVLKRNQIVIFAVALMLITAGYLNYTMNSPQIAETSADFNNERTAAIGDARLVSNNNVVEENNAVDNSTNVIPESNQSLNVESTSSEVKTSDKEGDEEYFTKSRMERENMYSEMLESYQITMANGGVSAEQKVTSQNEISKINAQKNAIMIAENLIKNKGFDDVLILVNDKSVSVVVKAEKIEEAEIAQIQSIVQRELNVEVENIHISQK